MASRTVTFLFTDIEGSTRLWDESPETMRPALARHDALLRAAIVGHGGETFKTVGDAFCAAFSSAPAGAEAALAAQRALAEEPWATPSPIRVRMALHTGTAEARDDDYFGPPLNRAARLLSTGHGGQTLVSAATYELVRDALPTGASLAPLGEHRLKDLARPEAVYGLSHPSLPSEFPSLRSLDSDALPNNLPEQTTSFVGREEELRKVAEGLKTTRLLTLVGPGGTGKTRLALQAAAEAVDAFPGGVWLVELAALEDPGLVAPTVAGVLGVVEEAGKPLVTTLAERLKKAPTLLVLDNCEHLLDAAARLADALVRAVPTLRILATSREPLGVGGETVHRVPTLSLPKREASHTPESLSHFEAVRLFVERAVAQEGDFAVTYENAPALASLCLRLDGIPLAIELAAARVRSLTVEQIEARLDDRFRLLTGGSRTALPRHQTLRALVEWSHDLLNDAERVAFRRLAAFAGGWTLDAAEAVVAGEGVEDWEVLDLLTSLVDKSLVGTEEVDGAIRYGMLETVRYYARERFRESGEESETVARHAAFFAALATKEGPQCREDGKAVRRLSPDEDNLRAAMDRGATKQKLAMAGVLRYFWSAKGAYKEGRKRAETALIEDVPPSLDDLRYGALQTASWFATPLGDLSASIAWSEEAVSLARSMHDVQEESTALNALGIALWYSGDLVRARELLESALSIRCWDAPLSNIAGVLIDIGDFAAAERALDQLGALLKDEPNDFDLYYYHRARGSLAYKLGNVDGADIEFQLSKERAMNLEASELILEAEIGLCDCRRIQGRLGDAVTMAREAVSAAMSAELRETALVALGRAALALAKVTDARAALLEYFQSRTSSYDILDGLDSAASLLAVANYLLDAVTLLGATSVERRRRPQPVPPVDLWEHEHLLAHLRASLGGTAFESAYAEGSALSTEATAAYAVAALERMG